MDFITQIRKYSGPLHSASEHTGFIKRIIDKKATVEGYAEYLFNLSVMYKAIEDGLEENINNNVLKDFATKELYRSELIQKDLNYLIGDKLDSLNLLASTQASLSRIKEISNSKPELLIAYAYTRFLADLFGGRIFYDLFLNHYKISDEGLNYYKFDKIEDVRSYAMKYASKLNSIELDDSMKCDFITEVNNAYIYNLAISNELETKLYPPSR